MEAVSEGELRVYERQAPNKDFATFWLIHTSSLSPSFGPGHEALLDTMQSDRF